MFIASDLRPYSIVESTAFRTFVKELDPRYHVPSRSHISQRVIPSLYEETRDAVMKQLDAAAMIALTTDGWTSRATQSYVTVTAHLITGDWQLKDFVLQTRIMNESHSGENLALLLEEAILEWNIKKPGSSGYLPIPITTDNASNMVSAVQKAPSFGLHLGCFAHSLNLACQRALHVPTVAKLLARIRRVVAFFHRSSTAAASLKQKQALLQVTQHKLIIDVPTRWNSAYDMVVRYLEQQAPIMAVLTQSDIRKSAKDVCSLSDHDIENAEQFVCLLKPMSIATALLCESQYPTASLVLPLKERLCGNYSPQTGDTHFASQVKAALRDDLQKRYTDSKVCQDLWQASALDPRFKALPTMNAERRHEVFSAIAIQLATCPTVKQEPGAAEDPAEGTPLTTTQSAITKEEPITGGDQKSALEDILGDVYVVAMQPSDSATRMQRVEAEVSKYRDLVPPLDLKSSPLKWWKDHQDEFPNLAGLARQVLCVPGTSVPSERVFSTAGDVVTSQRATLHPDNVDKLIFLKHNMSVDWFHFSWKDHVW